MSLLCDLNEVTIFVKVVQTGSFIGASRILDIPKATVSRKIAQLEETLGVRLLQRTTRKVNLTEVGRLYFDRCVRILDDLAEANLAVAEMQAIPYGTLRISASVVFGVTILHQWIFEFTRLYPQVKIEVFLSNQYVDMVTKGIDLAVRSGSLSDSSLVMHKLGEVPYWLCASPKYLASHGIPTIPTDLHQHHCITIMSESLSEIIPWTMKQGKELMEVKPEYRLRANDFLLIKQLLLSDFGIAYVPSITVLEEISNGSLVRVLSDWALMERELYLVYPSDRHLSPKVRALIEFIYQKVTPQAPWSTTDSE
jgi:DNA-binding transcriptional LysR family regulator